jgi:hypothetical protein
LPPFGPFGKFPATALFASPLPRVKHALQANFQAAARAKLRGKIWLENDAVNKSGPNWLERFPPRTELNVRGCRAVVSISYRHFLLLPQITIARENEQQKIKVEIACHRRKSGCDIVEMKLLKSFDTLDRININRRQFGSNAEALIVSL